MLVQLRLIWYKQITQVLGTINVQRKALRNMKSQVPLRM